MHERLEAQIGGAFAGIQRSVPRYKKECHPRGKWSKRYSYCQTLL